MVRGKDTVPPFSCFPNSSCVGERAVSPSIAV